MLALRTKRERQGWWTGPGWSETDTAKEWGIDPVEEWPARSALSRTRMMAYCQTKATMQTWESLDKKERARLIFEYRQKQR